jgi:glycosyltransferase involved in cell wall biosynthesis
MLRRRTGRPVIVLTLQATETGKFHRTLSLLAAPELVLSPVRETRDSLESLRINTDFIMPGYDPGLFRPVDGGTKAGLREKLGLPAESFIVLHVGHVKENRNLQLFLRYRDWGPDVKTVIKAAEVEPVWRAHMRQAGVIVLDEYTDDIHEIYQAADLYLFPVSERRAALEFPLSVIEASACNLPVLTTRFGALPEILESGSGLEWFAGVADIPGRIAALRQSEPDTLSKVAGFSWEKMFDRYLSPHLANLAWLPG